MPKYRPVKAKGTGAKGERKRAAVPCILFLITLMALLLLLFYNFMKGVGHAG